MKHLRTTIAGMAALALTAGVAGAAVATDDAESSGDPQPIGVFSIEEMPWLLTAQVVDGEMTPLPEGVVVSLYMEGGEVGGIGGCNNYFGSYELDGFDLTFSQIGSTQMFCEGPASDTEAAYFANLANVTAYQSGGIQMALLDANGDFLLEFDLGPEQSVVGDWAAQGINNGNNGVVSSATTPMVTATFTDAGELSGSDGCNQYTTTYTVDGDSIKVADQIASTRKLCEDEIMDQAQQYYAALTAATTWSVDATGNLELRDDGGSLQVRYSPATSAE